MRPGMLTSPLLLPTKTEVESGTSQRKMEPLLIQWKLERRTTSKPRRAGAGGAGSHMETLINNKLASMKFASHDDLY